uniref:Major facilitator superfamily protein n=1 Tax=Jahnella sp. MSr9139 TaxID=1434086 RepID=A0A4Y5SZK8_9BACT|nr:major facilitator superfamily protein [Jahnella sp. MSr9139]
MPALSQSRFLRFLTFGALYLAQGLPAGFASVGYVIFLTDQGLGNEAIGSAMGLMALPWTFKILWAPLLDRVSSTRFGRRRPFIILAQLAMGITLLLLALLDPRRELALIGAVLFLHSTCASFQDVAVDGMAVDLLQPKEQAAANGVMFAGKMVGAGVGGAGGAVLAKQLGWSGLILVITALLWAVMLLVILVRERPRGEVVEARAQPKLSLAELRRSFSFATPLVGIAVAMLTPVGFSLVLVVYLRMLRADLKLSEEAIGLLSGVVDPVAGVAGALFGGALASRIGVRKVLGGVMACLGAIMAAFVLAPGARYHFPFLAGFSGAAQFFIAAYSAVIIGYMMRLSNPAVGATQFSLFMASANLTFAAAPALGGRIADAYGVNATFAVGAAAQLVFIGILPFCDPRVAEARFRAAPPAPPVAAPEAALAD